MEKQPSWQENHIADYKAELENALYSAQKGQLSPYWQQECEILIEDAARQGILRAELAQTAGQLRSTIRQVPQLDDAQWARRQLAENGCELLYYDCPVQEHDTVIELIHCGDGGYYTAAVSLEAPAKGGLAAYAADRKQALLRWMGEQNIPVPPSPRQPAEAAPKRRYATLAQALAYMLAALDAPEQLP